MTTPLLLKGDKKDSSRQFQDSLREMTTRNNMQSFLNADIDAADTARKESTAQEGVSAQMTRINNSLEIKKNDIVIHTPNTQPKQSSIQITFRAIANKIYIYTYDNYTHAYSLLRCM